MAIVCHFGRPTLFITFTANPKWKEIQDELLLHQSAMDRPDLIARIFHLKQWNLLYQLRKDQIFGKFSGIVWTIEYQKRVLPHMYLLLFLHSEDRFLTPERIDEIVYAELPSQEQDPNGELQHIIGTSMVHGPCGTGYTRAPYLHAILKSLSKCSKHFPKAYLENTLVQEDGYSMYRRRNNGDTYVGQNGFIYDNP